MPAVPFLYRAVIVAVAPAAYQPPMPSTTPTLNVRKENAPEEDESFTAGLRTGRTVKAFRRLPVVVQWLPGDSWFPWEK